MIPWLLVAELLSVTNLPLSSMVNSRIAAYPSSGEINIKLKNPNESIKKVLDFYTPSASRTDFTDGINLECEEGDQKWRFNVRLSNTESVVRLNVETRGNRNLVNIKLKEILDILNG
jgi:phosphomannomutase